MRRFFIIAFVMFFSALQVYAQKTGYINTEKILSAIPEYTAAQTKLEAIGKQYQQKIESEYSKIEVMYNSYQQQKAGLSAQARQMKENEIIEREKNVKELQKTYFGQDGLMQKKSQELLDPIKEKVDAAINKVAQSGNFTIILDISIMQGVAWTNPQDDLSSQVIKALGYLF